MTKTNYLKPTLLKTTKESNIWFERVWKVDPSLHLEYTKLLSDMKEFNRDSSLVYSTLLSVNENEKKHSSKDIDKVFNLIPNNHNDAWEQLNAVVKVVDSNKKKAKTSYVFGSRTFRDPLRKKFFLAKYSDGKNTFLHSNPVTNHENNKDIVINVSHNIKTDNPTKKKGLNTSKELLSKYLSKKPIKFSNFKNEENIEYEFTYPVLHSKVITCISFIKRAVSIFFKCHGINFSSIDIVPISNTNYEIFIASSEASDVNSFCSQNSYFTFNGYMGPDEVECSPLANHFNLFLNEIFTKSNLYYFNQDLWIYLTFNIYSRDKSLRFNTIMNKRMERIIKTIRSLNNLHHKNNYEFDKSDFDNSYNNLDEAIKDYKAIYEQWFKDNAIPKSPEEEIEMLKKELAEKQELLKKSKK